MKLAVRSSSDVFENISLSIFEECDVEFAQEAVPANLKLLEGILKNDQGNPELLKLLSMGFCGYSMIFIESDNPERASRLYYRATEYGLKGLGYNGTPDKITKKEIEKLLGTLNENRTETLLWATVSWSSWININLHEPDAIAQLSMAQLCIDKLAESSPDAFYGLPSLLKAVSLSARSPMLGGNYEKSKKYYEKALLSGNRNFLLTQYYYARYYCVGTQNREMFTSLLSEIIDNAKEYPDDLCLLNMSVRLRAETLLKNIDDYFI